MAYTETMTLARGALACATSLSLALGLFGGAATRALAEAAGDDGIQVVGEDDPAGDAARDADGQDARVATGQDAEAAAGRGGAIEAGGAEPSADAEAGAADTEAGASDAEGKDPRAVAYVDEHGEPHVVTDYTDISDKSFEDKVGYGLVDGWYVVRSSRDFEHRLTVTGDAKLVLCDGATANFTDGIRGYSGKLTIYAQSTGGNMGKLVATADGGEAAGIGGNNDEDNNTEIVICGGRIEATGDDYGAGIGGGDHGGCGTITILGGDVTAQGGGPVAAVFVYGGAAGIGSGDAAKKGGSVEINGGTVMAYGGPYAAGIGTGDEAKAPVDVSITGGTVSSEGYQGGAGIGGGNETQSGKIRISGGKVTARSFKGYQSDYGGGYGCGAGIGGGDEGGCDVEISGGYVRATSGTFGAGIGTGDECDGACRVTISGGEVDATGGWKAAGIGGGNESDGGTIAISGGHVVARASRCPKGELDTGGAGIGGGDEGDSGTIAISGGVVEAEAIHEKAAAIGHGNGGRDRKVSIPDGFMVSDKNNEDGVAASERLARLSRSGRVEVAPCGHAGGGYEQTERGHRHTCPHCLAKLGEEEPHEFDGAGVCAKCGKRQGSPLFDRATVDPAGACGLTFWVRLPEGDQLQVEGVELSVGGGQARTEARAADEALRDGEGRYGFLMPLTAIEMAEPVRAVVRYNGGRTVEATESMERAIAREARPGTGGTSHLEALANLGHYTMPWLSARDGWEIGVDYAPMKLSYGRLNDVGVAKFALESHADDCRVAEGEGHVGALSCSVRLDSTSTLQVRVRPAAGERFADCRATIGGREASCEVQRDGRLCVRAAGLTPRDWGDLLQVEGRCGDGEFRVQASVLGYVDRLMERSASDKTAEEAPGEQVGPLVPGGSGSDKVADEALASMYWLYHYTKNVN